MFIDTTRIAGYESMTEDQKNSIASYEPTKEEIQATEYYKKAKASFEKTASELAQLKRDSKTTLTESETQLQAMQEQLNQLLEHNKVLEKEKNIAKTTQSYIAQGYSEVNAKGIAEAMHDGKTDDVIKYNKAHLDELAKTQAKSKLSGTPAPKSTGDDKNAGLTTEDLLKMTSAELIKLKTEQPEVFKELQNKF